jgi:ureidoacrylate peracid hydrolase
LAENEFATDPYLSSIVAPEWAALLVVDVQNDFCHQDGLFGRLGLDMTGVQAAARSIAALLPAARQAGVPVVFVMMEHDPLTNSEA